jgi:hypothetical protein
MLGAYNSGETVRFLAPFLKPYHFFLIGNFVGEGQGDFLSSSSLLER